MACEGSTRGSSIFFVFSFDVTIARVKQPFSQKLFRAFSRCLNAIHISCHFRHCIVLVVPTIKHPPQHNFFSLFFPMFCLKRKLFAYLYIMCVFRCLVSNSETVTITIVSKAANVSKYRFGSTHHTVRSIQIKMLKFYRFHRTVSVLCLFVVSLWELFYDLPVIYGRLSRRRPPIRWNAPLSKWNSKLTEAIGAIKLYIICICSPCV